VFNILGPPPGGARALDLYAGSGALGLEALSRGCADAVFVEQAPPALAALRANIAALELEERARVVENDAVRAIERLARGGEQFDWIFVDPPYAAHEIDRALDVVPAVCKRDGTVIAEHDRRRAPALDHSPLLLRDQRRYGDTCVSFYGLEMA